MQAEILFGPSRFTGNHPPFRLGPFLSVAAQSQDDWGVQATGGLTALVWARRPDGEDIALGVSASFGAIVDAPSGRDTRFGGLARLSLGMTSAGRSPLKFVSVWLFAEGHWVPDPAGDRVEVLAGVRTGLVTFPAVLVPGFLDN